MSAFEGEKLSSIFVSRIGENLEYDKCVYFWAFYNRFEITVDFQVKILSFTGKRNRDGYVEIASCEKEYYDNKYLTKEEIDDVLKTSGFYFVKMSEGEDVCRGHKMDSRTEEILEKKYWEELFLNSKGADNLNEVERIKNKKLAIMEDKQRKKAME